MSSPRVLTAAVLAGTLLVSCSEAHFYGTAPGRAQQLVTPGPPGGGVSCSVLPATVKIGGKALISVTDTAADAGLAQSVGDGDRKTEAALVLTKGVYTLATGADDDVLAEAAGHYTVELRRKGDPAVVANCAFDVTSEGPPPPPSPPPPPPPELPPLPPPLPPPVLCKDTEHATGAHIAFLIDNSGSNSATDCPAAQRTGSYNGADTYECRGVTNREKAVLAAFDLLQAVAAKEPGSSAAASTIAIASFPTRADFMSGWQSETRGALDVSAGNRAAAGSALAFSRQPFGQTPYGGALSAASELFRGLADDGKPRVAILVTDGEPTDRSPGTVSAQADALRHEGVEVITVFYAASQTRASRVAEHADLMRRIDDATLTHTGQHWYDASFASLAAYVQTLVGGNGQKSLAAAISSSVVEVQDSSALRAAFQALVKTKIACE